MKTIIFDVDDTLYDQLQPFQNTVKQQLDPDFPAEKIADLYLTSRKYSDEVFEKHMSGEITALELQTYRITQACKEFGIDMSYEEAVTFQEVYLRQQQQITLFPEWKDLLDKFVKDGLQLAILTNGELKHQMMKVKQLGISKWIAEENIFVSGDIGHSKPNPIVFYHVEEKLHLEKDSTLYIGDSYENDIIGAKQVGWKAIWMNHRLREKPDTEWLPDDTITHSSELAALFTSK
ncbi:HAD family hydrolase [Gracilibacillus sp. YIM 98692]|uniref:HAD family hydrolase n=1 Tax=Gracilibacillus sp. YIM 98692 TaxID=2663532 RepID=UPI0013D1E490|nr:HAD family hydrolase [Gracilibacillus sp. YIM 98692]